ncbi:recombinase family protein [bacterium]|nr:recombinase family protein [bacterium]
MTKTKVVGYVRVSTQEQACEGHSLAAQEAKLRAYAELYDLELVRIETDAGQSGKNLDRPGLQRALDGMRAGDAEALLIPKLDRLTRSVADMARLIDEFFGERSRHKAALLSVADQIDTRTAGGRLVLNVLVSVAQWEREANAERTKAALDHKKSKGEYVGGTRPFGFELDGTRLVAIPQEQEAITLILDLRGQGHTLREIAAELTRRGIGTKRGGRWHVQTVKNILARSSR